MVQVKFSSQKSKSENCCTYGCGVRHAGDCCLNEAQTCAEQIHQCTKKRTELEFEHLLEISRKILVHEITAILRISL